MSDLEFREFARVFVPCRGGNYDFARVEECLSNAEILGINCVEKRFEKVDRKYFIIYLEISDLFLYARDKQMTKNVLTAKKLSTKTLNPLFVN